MSRPGHETTGRRYRPNTAAGESTRKSRGDVPPVQYGNGPPYGMAPMAPHYGAPPAPYDPYAYPPGLPGPPSQMSGDSHGHYSHGRPAYVDAAHPHLPRGPSSSQDPSLTSDSGSYSSEHPSSPGYDRGTYPPTPLSPYGGYHGYPGMPMPAHVLAHPPPDPYGIHHPMPPPQPSRKGHKKHHSYAAPGAPGYYAAPGAEDLPHEQGWGESDNDDVEPYPIDPAPQAPTAPNSTVKSRGQWPDDIPSGRSRTAFTGSGGYQPPPADDASRRGRETYGGPEELGRGRRSVPPTAGHGAYLPPKTPLDGPPYAETPPSSHEEWSPRASRRGGRSRSRVRQSDLRRPRSKSRLRRHIQDTETTAGPVQTSEDPNPSFDLQKPPRRRPQSRMGRRDPDASSARYSSPDRRTYGSNMPAAPDPLSPEPSSSPYDDFSPALAPAPQLAPATAATTPPAPAPATLERPGLPQTASYPPPAGGSTPVERPALPHNHTYHGPASHYPGVTYTAPTAPPAETAPAPAQPLSILRNANPDPSAAVLQVPPPPPAGSYEPDRYIRPYNPDPYGHDPRYNSQPVTYQELAPAHDYRPSRRGEYRDSDYYYDDRSRRRGPRSRPPPEKRGKSRLREKSRHRSPSAGPSRRQGDDYGVEYGRGAPRERRDRDRRRRDGEQAQREAHERATAEAEQDRKLAELLATAASLSQDPHAIDVAKDMNFEIPGGLGGGN